MRMTEEEFRALCASKHLNATIQAGKGIGKNLGNVTEPKRNLQNIEIAKYMSMLQALRYMRKMISMAQSRWCLTLKKSIDVIWN